MARCFGRDCHDLEEEEEEKASFLVRAERERERERERDIPRAGAALANDGGALAMIAFKAVPGVAAEAA